MNSTELSSGIGLTIVNELSASNSTITPTNSTVPIAIENI